MKFHPLYVSSVVKETEDCVSVSFDIPPELTSSFRFVPGQYLTVETQIEDQRVRRSYSICSHPNDPLRVAIKQVEGGLFSTWANTELKAGMSIDVTPPEGTFIHEPNAENENTYVAFSAGSGITPILSIVKSVLIDEPQSSFVLFYGNKLSKNIIFKEELEGLKNKYMDRLQIYHILSREKTDAPIFSGRITSNNCSTYFKYFIGDVDVAKVFLCGPYDMLIDMKENLPSHGVAADKIKLELFYNPEADHGVKEKEELLVEKEERTIKITLDGLTSEIKSRFDIPILDMAIEAGLDLPYSCKGGVCATCKAKIEEGKIEMTTNFALEDEEVDQGYVLSCQSHVKSDFVHVNFDV